MSSHRARSSERARTLAQFDAFNLNVRVFEDTSDVPSSANNRANGEHILDWTVDERADLLFVEDDIDLAPDFPAALEAARALGEPVTFWLDDARIHPAWIERGLHLMPTTFGWRGSQALFIPFERTQKAVRHPQFGNGQPPPIDGFLKHAGALTGLRVALPNPVEHRSPASLVDAARPVRKSLTFGMSAFGDWGEHGTRVHAD